MKVSYSLQKEGGTPLSTQAFILKENSKFSVIESARHALEEEEEEVICFFFFCLRSPNLANQRRSSIHSNGST